MDDLISRQAAIGALNALVKDGHAYVNGAFFETILRDEAKRVLEELPSAQLDANEYRKRGEWDMFELITSVWYGKQCYFEEDNGMAYSRKSHKTMTVHDAILEFIREIGNE